MGQGWDMGRTEHDPEPTISYRVRNLRQLSRGFEADVTLGTDGPPGASVQMKVCLSVMDPAWKALRSDIEALFAQRAEESLRSTLGYADSHKPKKTKTRSA